MPFFFERKIELLCCFFPREFIAGCESVKKSQLFHWNQIPPSNPIVDWLLLLIFCTSFMLPKNENRFAFIELELKFIWKKNPSIYNRKPEYSLNATKSELDWIRLEEIDKISSHWKMSISSEKCWFIVLCCLHRAMHCQLPNEAGWI